MELRHRKNKDFRWNLCVHVFISGVAMARKVAASRLEVAHGVTSPLTDDTQLHTSLFLSYCLFRFIYFTRQMLLCHQPPPRNTHADHLHPDRKGAGTPARILKKNSQSRFPRQPTAHGQTRLGVLARHRRTSSCRQLLLGPETGRACPAFILLQLGGDGVRHL